MPNHPGASTLEGSKSRRISSSGYFSKSSQLWIQAVQLGTAVQTQPPRLQRYFYRFLHSSMGCPSDRDGNPMRSPFASPLAEAELLKAQALQS